MIGQAISHYRILAKIDEGGMGAVYRAEDLTLGRHALLKFLPSALTDDPTSRRRFIHEPNAAALDHSGSCTVYEVGEADDQRIIAMALPEGHECSDRVTLENGGSAPTLAGGHNVA